MVGPYTDISQNSEPENTKSLNNYPMFLQCKNYHIKLTERSISLSPADSAVDIEINITCEKHHQLWQQDHFCKRIGKQLQTIMLQPGNH